MRGLALAFARMCTHGVLWNGCLITAFSSPCNGRICRLAHWPATTENTSLSLSFTPSLVLLFFSCIVFFIYIYIYIHTHTHTFWFVLIIYNLFLEQLKEEIPTLKSKQQEGFKYTFCLFWESLKSCAVGHLFQCSCFVFQYSPVTLGRGCSPFRSWFCIWTQGDRILFTSPTETPLCLPASSRQLRGAGRRHEWYSQTRIELRRARIHVGYYLHYDRNVLA